MEGLFLTDTGQVRRHNEDAGGVYKNASGQIMAVIADGMGGHRAGDVASQMATKQMEQKWLATSELTSPEKAEEWLSHALNDINHSIYQHSIENEECKGMGTTIVIAICTNEFFTIAHIGDSRCYVLNEHGFNQVTEDHSLVNELVRSGQITKVDAQHHPRKNIVLKALGTEEQVASDIQSISWESGDKLLLCSDGLTDKVEDEELFTFIQEATDLKTAGQQMIQLANERGGEDNVSLVMIQHISSEKAGDEAC
ncbi:MULTISPECIES: Stp1/IreP family PP2C-type Ser/Thr phosphatase [unclassified Virgibacillus]|uniref:Stp1/IreP family PP2C-type Ser/Thr phosphatase n=1 Tax=unclassified Virgibacillus TaxID=2620237 RepID=UPI0024DE1A7A|nr:Stp1/IreP family PP2C-type Ser/Thr phosphatase [Virgibacillus sp. LDC-1]